MNLAILGGTGKTGQTLVSQALMRGHKVTVVVRNIHKVEVAKNLTIVQGDVTQPSSLVPLFVGQNAVLSTLGNNDASLALIERSTKAIIEAMKKSGVKRIIVESAYGASETARLSKLVRNINVSILGSVIKDKQKGEAILKKSGLIWTLVYPVRLTNGQLGQNARVIPGTEKIGARYKISRADVASFMLDAVENNTYVKEVPVIAAG